MWAIDATQITTVQDGKVWLFGVAEHWNAELLGWHVSKRGTRFEAIEALGMAVRQQFGRLSAGAARGVAVRHDHGSNFMADDFQSQARFWGSRRATPSSASQETNGVIERLFRTLKEQAVHGRVFQTIDEVRGAIRAFATCYNAEWLIEKNGHRSPLDRRDAWLDQGMRSRPPDAIRPIPYGFSYNISDDYSIWEIATSRRRGHADAWPYQTTRRRADPP